MSPVGCIHVFGMFAQPKRLLALMRSAELPPEIHRRSTAIPAGRSLNPTSNAIKAHSPGAIWTCPMQPQVWQSAPGSCPICGMALEPLEPTLEEGPNPELIAMSWPLWVCAALSVPLLLLTMGAELLNLQLVPMQMSMWLQFALTMPVVTA